MTALSQVARSAIAADIRWIVLNSIIDLLWPVINTSSLGRCSNVLELRQCALRGRGTILPIKTQPLGSTDGLAAHWNPRIEELCT
jgi:hypothetical protein